MPENNSYEKHLKAVCVNFLGVDTVKWVTVQFVFIHMLLVLINTPEPLRRTCLQVWSLQERTFVKDSNEKQMKNILGFFVEINELYTTVSITDTPESQIFKLKKFVTNIISLKQS